MPRGRVGAFIGSGVGYNLLRTRYQTGVGPVGLDFHGVEVPVEANLSVYVLERLAIGVQFDYMWTWYGLARTGSPPSSAAAVPMSVLQAAAQQQSVDLRGELPQLWTLGLAIRGRLWRSLRGPRCFDRGENPSRSVRLTSLRESVLHFAPRPEAPP